MNVDWESIRSGHLTEHNIFYAVDSSIKGPHACFLSKAIIDLALASSIDPCVFASFSLSFKLAPRLPDWLVPENGQLLQYNPRRATSEADKQYKLRVLGVIRPSALSPVSIAAANTSYNHKLPNFEFDMPVLIPHITRKSHNFPGSNYVLPADETEKNRLLSASMSTCMPIYGTIADYKLNMRCWSMPSEVN